MSNDVLIHNKPAKLVIKFKNFSKPEVYKNVSDPHRVVSRRNVPNIEYVTYAGQPLDISEHLKLYPEPKKDI
jgi:hypothetical protein